MTDRNPSKSMTFGRRAFLRSGAACAVSGALPAHLAMAADLTLHEQVAQWVRDATGPAPGKLSVLCPEGSQRNLFPITQAFTAMTGVEIDLRSIASHSLTARIALEVIAGEGSFDVALPATYGLPDLVSSDVILPLDDFVDAYEPAGFREGSIYRLGDTVDQKTYGFQADGDAYIMFYLKEVLQDPVEQARYADTYGTALDVPQTWEELDRQMAWFHRPDEGLFGGLLLRTPDYVAWEFWMRLHGYGMWPFSEDMECQINTPEGHVALADMRRSAEHLHPGTGSFTFVENWEAFLRGQTYCNIGWGGAQKSFNEKGAALRGRLTYGAPPGGPLGPGGAPVSIPYFNWGWSFVVNRASSRPRIGYLFSLFASTPEMSTRSVREAGGFFDPNRPEHYADSKIREVYSPEFLTVHKASLEQAIPDLYLHGHSEYFRVLNDALFAVLSGETDPRGALDRTAQLWEMITSRYGRARQITRWRQLRARYPANIARVLRDAKST